MKSSIAASSAQTSSKLPRAMRIPNQSSVFDDEPDIGTMALPELLALVQALRSARRTSVIREDRTRHKPAPHAEADRPRRRMLGDSTSRGDLVLDPFAGSGSTLVAARLMGRCAAAIELEPRFCDVITGRWLGLDPAAPRPPHPSRPQ